MRNVELRAYAKQKRVNLWEVAERFGVCDARFSVKLRHDFSESDADRFRKFVDEIAESRGEE